MEMIRKIKYIKKLLQCNIEIYRRRQYIFPKNIIDASKPFTVDFVLDSANNNNNGNDNILHHYLLFCFDHIEAYILTVLFTFILDLLYQTYKCYSDNCEL